MFVIAIAIVLTTARALLPQAERYRTQIETEVSQLIGQPLTIADFELGWHGLGPRVYLKGVEIGQHDGGKALFGFDQAHVDIALWSSLRSGELDFGAFTLSGLDLSLVRREDGSLGLEGVVMPAVTGGEGASLAASRNAAIDWLWRQGHLALEESVVQFRDMAAGGEVWRFEQLYLHLRNSGSRARLSGSMALPAQLGQALAFVVEVERRGEALSDWEGSFYLKGEALQLPALLKRLELPLGARKGMLAGQLWGRWQAGALTELRGEIGLERVQLIASAPASAADAAQGVRSYLLDHLSGRFVWQGSGQQGVVDVDRLRLGASAELWPETRAHVTYEVAPGQLHLEGGITFARLESLLPLALLAPLPERGHEALAALNPRGEVSNTFFRFTRGSDHPPEFFLQAVFADVGVDAWQQLPGVEGLDGSLNLDNRSGVVDFATVDARFDSAGLFREVLPITSFDGRLAWARFEQGLHLDMRRLMVANDDLAGELEGHLFLPAGEASPQIGLIAQLDYADGSMVSRYLPTRIMPATTVEWLDGAILNGFVTDATVVVHGPLRRFPFDHGEGRFEVRANLIDGVLDYSPGWPRMEQIEAELLFSGRAMTVSGHRAEMLNTELEAVRVAIADMHAKPVVVEISGRARGGTEDVVRYLNESPPLHKLFGSFLGDAVASGHSDLRLDLKLPLGSERPVEVQGHTVLEASAIEFKSMGVDLGAINGKVAFSNEGLQAQQLAVTVMGQPARVDIYSQRNGHRSMVFEAKGRTRYPELERRFGFIPVFGYMAGQSDWQALLTIPQAGGDGAAISLSIKSDLVGSSILLPEPLHKSADLARPFIVEGELGEALNRWQFDYDHQRLSGIFLSPHQGALAGELRFAGQAPEPQLPGIRVAGELDFFSEEAWWPILFADDETAAGGGDGGDEVGVNRLAVEVKRAQLFGLDYSNLSLEASREGGVWSARVVSDQLRGELFVPEDWSLPLEAKLDYLFLPLAGSDGAEAGGAKGGGGLHDFDPATLPPLRLTSKVFDYGGQSLGQLRVTTERRLNGLSIETLQLDSPFASIRGNGAWNYVGGQHNSVFNAEMEVRDLGKLLTALDFGGMIEGGQGKGRLSLRWAAPLVEMEPMLLNGAVNIDFRDGSILEVDPGAGRIFSLFSPRRLLLDFRDMGKGLAFDRMRGRFDIRSGNAFTQDFMLDGPVAKVEARGRIGLGAEDYDQALVVTPHVTSSLPLIGAVVQGSLGVGAVVLLAERLLKPAIDEASKMRYVVTGSWDNPQVKLLDLKEESDDGNYLPELLRDD